MKVREDVAAPRVRTCPRTVQDENRCFGDGPDLHVAMITNKFGILTIEDKNYRLGQNVCFPRWLRVFTQAVVPCKTGPRHRALSGRPSHGSTSPLTVSNQLPYRMSSYHAYKRPRERTVTTLTDTVAFGPGPASANAPSTNPNTSFGRAPTTTGSGTTSTNYASLSGPGPQNPIEVKQEPLDNAPVAIGMSFYPNVQGMGVFNPFFQTYNGGVEYDPRTPQLAPASNYPFPASDSKDEHDYQQEKPAYDDANDLALLQSLKQQILNGQHPAYRARPHVENLRALWKGPVVVDKGKQKAPDNVRNSVM